MQLVISHVNNNEQDGGHANRILHWLWVKINRKGQNQGPLVIIAMIANNGTASNVSREKVFIIVCSLIGHDDVAIYKH